MQKLSNLPDEDRPYLLICGEGKKRNELLNLAKSNNFEKSLFMPGYRYDMPEIFKIADLFVFPSYHEGLSFALMQAMAAELPIVCSKIRGNVDVVDNNKGGYIVSPDDVDGIKKGISCLLRDELKSKEFGQYNYEKVKRYSIQNVRKELRELYSKV